MNTRMQRFLPRASWSSGWLLSIFACGVGLGFFLSNPYAIAQQTDVPWECSEYSPEAQARCMKTLLELQQEKIGRLKEQLKAQEGTVNELKEKMDRQDAVSQRENQIDKRNPRYPPPYVPAYAFPYGYTPLPPIGIYLQPPWRGPRYYGYGPGSYGYGPGYWRQPGLSFNYRFGGGHRHHHR